LESTTQYGLAQAKARLSELTSLVDSGEEVVIAKHGRPSYKLIAIQTTPAHGLPSAEKAPGPSSLNDMASFISQTRRLTRAPASSENFVEALRKSDRY
jgi:prevent-host-death family protein